MKLFKSRLQGGAGSAKQKAPESVSQAKPSGRLEIDRVEWPRVVGWGVEADLAPAAISLLCDGNPCEATLVRVPRADVDVALGLSAGALVGFELTLHPSVWQPMDSGQAHVLEIQAAGQKRRLPWSAKLPEALDQWAQALAAQAPGLNTEKSLRELMQHVAWHGGASVLSAPWNQWLSDAAQERSLSGQLSVQEGIWPEPVAPQGGVESFEATVLQGWACVPGSVAERIELRCNGQRLPATVIRTQRDDVQRTLGAERSQLGFEIEVPGEVWRHVAEDGRCVLSVHVNHLPFEPTWELNPQALVGELNRLMVESQRLQSLGAQAVDPREHQYRLLLGLEHLAASGLGATLPPELMSFLRAQAQHYGVDSLFQAADSTAAQPGLPALANLAHDPTTVAVWRLLRQFNEDIAGCVDQPEGCLEALEQLLGSVGFQGEASQRFLLGVLPYFCRLRAYDRLRRHLSGPRLRALGTSHNVWEQSLFLPELVCSGDFAWAASLVESMAQGGQGWLNTECVAQAAHTLVEQCAHGPVDDPLVLKLVEQLVALLGHLGWDGWSRSHDRELIQTAVSLLSLCPALPGPLAYQVSVVVVRVYALLPDFWDVLQERLPEPTLWPAVVREAQGALHALQQALRPGVPLDGATVWRLLPQLRPLLVLQSVEAIQTVRELLLAMVPLLAADDAPDALAAFAELSALRRAEPLRLVAHPQWQTHGVIESADLKARVRSITGVPRLLRAESVKLVLGQLRLLASGAAAAPSQASCRVLTRADDGYAGAYLLTLRWLLLRDGFEPAERLQALSELREALHAVLTHTEGWAQRPAALFNAVQTLERELEFREDEGMRQLVQACRQVLAQPSLIPTVPRRSLRSAGLMGNTLVVIYSCRRNLPTRVAQIRQTWARDLTRRGIPWLVAVGDGQDTIEPDQVLGLKVSDAYEDLPAKTLALIHWVVAHTDVDHLMKIDDDCHLAVDAFFDESPHLTQHYLGRWLHRAEGGTDRLWHQGKALTRRGALALDKSPEPSVYADGGAGYVLSRHAMAALCQQLTTTAGAKLTRSAFMEDKLVGDLLAQAGIHLSSEGYETLVRRRTGPGAVPVNAHQNSFYPGLSSPTLVTHLDDAMQLPAVESMAQGPALLPPRLWPTNQAPVLGGVMGTNQLELLSSVESVRRLAQAPVLVVAVARNERVLMPHFLAHYRRLGVAAFVLVDNLSDDGTREYLLQQDDVVLYSADTEYRHSHYGVAWQQAVLGAHALNKWVILADIDEFLVFPDCESVPVSAWLAARDAAGHDAVLTLMVDMYPQGDLGDADFDAQAPFEVATHFDAVPVIPWRLGSGCFSNGPTYLSALRHRLIPDSAPNLYTSQKVAILRYRPWIRLSEGLHYASNIQPASVTACFAHFKYHAGFKAKVHAEIARKQHFNGAEEYRKYLAMVGEGLSEIYSDACSSTYQSSASFDEVMARAR